MSRRISKDDYTLRSLSKIRHKRWELYVISRIIHKLDDPEIEFVCQQLVRTKDGNRYLADLCFPGLKIYCEVDELQHAHEEHRASDRNRQREILDATDFEERRIRVYADDRDYLPLAEINKTVDEFVDLLRTRKQELRAEGKFIPWDYESKYSPEPHIERGYIDVQDNVAFTSHRDAMRCFGYPPGKGHHQGSGWPPRAKRRMWFPKLYPNAGWDNSISDDWARITMRTADGSDITSQLSWEKTLGALAGDRRIVFAHYSDALGRTVYKFFGEFEISLEDSNPRRWEFHRIAARVELTDLRIGTGQGKPGPLTRPAEVWRRARR